MSHRNIFTRENATSIESAEYFFFDTSSRALLFAADDFVRDGWKAILRFLLYSKEKRSVFMTK